MDKDTVCSVPPIQQMAPSREHVKPALCSVLQICGLFRVRVSVTKGGWRGREKPNKQVSLNLHRMFNYRHQNRDDRWIINIAYITMKRRTNSQATFQYADSEHLWLFHTRVKYGLPLFTTEITLLSEKNKSTFHNHCFWIKKLYVCNYAVCHWTL